MKYEDCEETMHTIELDRDRAWDQRKDLAWIPLLLEMSNETKF